MDSIFHAIKIKIAAALNYSNQLILKFRRWPDVQIFETIGVICGTKKKVPKKDSKIQI